MKMKKMITTSIATLLLVGCTGGGVSPKVKEILHQAKGYQVGKVNVALKKASFLDYSDEQKLYPSTQQLATYFKHDIAKYLQQKGKLCSSAQACPVIDVAINYGRIFNLKSVTVSDPIIDRTITIHKGDTVLYTNTKTDIKPHSVGILGNALNELKVFTDAGKSKPNLEKERKDISIISKVTVEDIMGL